MEQPSAPTEQDFLEDNIATMAFHMGHPGASLTVLVGGEPRLVVDPGEVLQEASRRLSLKTARHKPTALQADAAVHASNHFR
jgi:hypothetical protein